ncbi:MAG: Peptide methionine sulfoxide reductase MsrA 2 [candidate division WS2 bacterium ADurb.Bin280]|uniref:Peptide methionine sulfoxide reductase MsrA n=1 Tax=candidate division WS2 bacterium ADurb.Bin280 TaxID=1852829 RepID=A0A1V5SF97_9BACT|nr:MAG: Peptide methionine sulfoxide reductase MsrA 2 [candidate division WS2 bacterium ADurb.Bin280]
MKKDTAIFASGCFWGTQYYLSKAVGVVKTQVGYTGGELESPTYEQVCSGKTGHVEAVKVEYDPDKTNYENLSKLFFETHDFSQKGGQGPDIGSQYESVIFYANNQEKKIAQVLINELENRGMKVATKIAPRKEFYVAEEYHQDYYLKNQQTPYCHRYRKLFS